MYELLLCILCYPKIKVIACFQEHNQKEGETTASVTTESRSGRAPSGRDHRPEVNPTELTQLMDMGFSREHCYEALILTATLEHATDYLLNNFPHSQAGQSTVCFKLIDVAVGF